MFVACLCSCHRLQYDVRDTGGLPPPLNSYFLSFQFHFLSLARWTLPHFAMSDIVSPDDVKMAVVPLPDTQFPYGAGCVLDRQVQSVFFHYDIDLTLADFVASVGFVKIKNVRMANPDGSDEERQLFKESIADHCTNPLARALIKGAFRRLLAPVPFAAIVDPAPPPAKKAKSASGSSSTPSSIPSSASSSGPPPGTSSSVASSSGGDPPVASTSASAKASGRSRALSGSSSDSYDDDVAGVDEDPAAANDDLRSSRASDIPTLFDNLSSEVMLDDECGGVGPVHDSRRWCSRSCLDVLWRMFFAFQSLQRRKRNFLARCKAQIEIEDAPPYHHLVEGLAVLKDSIVPRRYPSSSGRRRSAKRLRTILEGTFERMKMMAKMNCSGMAQLLYTEIAGHGGLPIFRRIDAAVRASERVRTVGGGGYRGRGAGFVERGRGGLRGRGGRPRDLAGVECFNCFQRGHMRNSCPLPDRAGGVYDNA